MVSFLRSSSESLVAGKSGRSGRMGGLTGSLLASRAWQSTTVSLSGTMAFVQLVRKVENAQPHSIAPRLFEVRNVDQPSQY